MKLENNYHDKVMRIFQEATNVGREALSNLPVREYSTFEKMCICYLKKQINHAIVIRKIGNNYDIKIIGRSMLEAMFSLLWTAEEPEIRAERWDDSKIIYDLKKMLLQKKIGKPIDKKIEKTIIHEAEKYAKKYFPKKKKKVSILTIEDNLFSGHWSGLSIFKIVESLKDTDSGDNPGESGKYLYWSFYFECSEWIHTTSSLFYFFPLNKRSPEIYDEEFGYRMLAPCIQALLQTIDLFNEVFKIDLENKMTNIRNEYLNTFKNLKKQSKKY